MTQNDAFSKLLQWIKQLFAMMYEGFLFIGDTGDLITAFIDIAVTSWLFYQILKLVRDSRAWQLLKGVVLILLLAMVSRVAGLSAIGYMLNNTISVFAIAFVVLFQPELRRALETVGRSGFKVITGTESQQNRSPLLKTIEAIVGACEDMVRTNTGALMVIERSTPLGDLEKQDNAVVINADVSETLLKQIFYFGSPLHDGAALIKEGKVLAARIHIPLSDGFHVRKDRGTRHRAAMEASTIGDTIAVIVSEEHRMISIASEGRLYTLKDAQALKMQLQKLLIPEDTKAIPFFNRRLRTGAKAGVTPSRTKRRFKRRKAALVLSSVLMALSVWLYVQATVNPLKQRNFAVPLVFRGENKAHEAGLMVDLPVEKVNILLTARQNQIETLSTPDVIAYIDLEDAKLPGVKEMKVNVDINTKFHTRTDNINPGKIYVSLRPIERESLEENSGEAPKD